MQSNVRYFKPISVFLASMFGGPLAGTYMVTVNAKNLGYSTNRILLWVLGIVLFLFEARTRALGLMDGPLRGRWFAIHQLLVPTIIWSFAYLGAAKKIRVNGVQVFSVGRVILITLIGLVTSAIPTAIRILLAE